MKTRTCYGCSRECGEDEFCNGCGYYICYDCEEGYPTGKHGPGAHFFDYWEDEEE